jgi:hypothetical protein
LVAVVSQAPKSAQDLGVFGHDFIVGTDIETGSNPSNAAHVLACEMVKREDPLTTDEAHDRIVVFACGGEICDIPVAVPIVWDDHKMGLTA